MQFFNGEAMTFYLTDTKIAMKMFEGLGVYYVECITTPYTMHTCTCDIAHSTSRGSPGLVGYQCKF